MHPKPMTNDSDRVAPDRRIQLPSPTPVRPRRRIAASVLSVLLGLSCFAASPAWAVKLGENANDATHIPVFDNVAAYLENPAGDSPDYGYVKIKHSSAGTVYTYTLERGHLDAFHKTRTLTDAKLIKRYRDAAAYNADQTRANRLYAYIGDKVYRVTELERLNIDPLTLNDDNLPDPVEKIPGNNTAIGNGASATEYRATAIGVGARATDRGTVAIGHQSRASGWKAVAIGSQARTNGGPSIAMGRNALAYGYTPIALGPWSNAYGGGAVSLASGATAGGGAMSLGAGATALGESATAVGRGARAALQSSRSVNVRTLLSCAYHQDFTSSHCNPLLTATERADTKLTANTVAGKAFRDVVSGRLIDSIAAVGATALGSGSRATASDGTALGSSSWAAGSDGSTAVGGRSRATGERSTALGAAAKAGGLRSTAVGQDSQAQGADTVAVGRNAVAGGSAAGSSMAGLRVGNTYDDVAAYLADKTRTAHTNVRIGSNVYQVTALEAVVSLTKDNLPTSLTVATGGVALGVSAAAAGMDSIALGRGASATGTRGIAIGSGVSAGQNEVVIGAGTHTYKLPGLVKTTHTSGTRVVTVDSNGRLSTQAATSSSPAQGASLRGAAVLSSEATALNRDLGTQTDAADYEKAPAIGSGPEAPETADQRRVVVQDTNRDGSVRLRTLDFGDLSGMDRRLAGVEQRMTSLGDRLNKATAMSAALSALPNVVPGDNRFFLGVGAGHYSSEQALAIGMSARVGRHVFVNAGAALASGDDASVRGGVGVVW